MDNDDAKVPEAEVLEWAEAEREAEFWDAVDRQWSEAGE